jgi:iron complex transport system ATP-binding protein
VLRLGFERGGAPVPATALGALAEEFGLHGLLDRRWSSLSGGERGRALAASVLAPAPPVVLADEPAAALDVGQAAALMARLRTQAAGGAAVAVVAHDLNLAAQWCDRLILLCRGQVALSGSTAEVANDVTMDRVFATRFDRLRTPDGRVLLAPAASERRQPGAPTAQDEGRGRLMPDHSGYASR